MIIVRIYTRNKNTNFVHVFQKEFRTLKEAEQYADHENAVNKPEMILFTDTEEGEQE